jgi:hypothetical protein
MLFDNEFDELFFDNEFNEFDELLRVAYSCNS